MKWGRRVMGIARGRRRGRKFVNFAITAVLAFNRRGFVIRRGSVIVAVAWRRRRSLIFDLMILQDPPAPRV